MIRRQSNVLSSVNSSPEWGAAYRVIAYRRGGEVSVSSSDVTAQLYLGHGFAVLDKFIVFNFGQYIQGTIRTVSAVTPTGITFDAAVSLVTGDILVNLGQDGGGAVPSYDGSPIATYDDMGGATATVQGSSQTTDSFGNYGYWHRGSEAIWELLIDPAGNPVAVDRSAWPDLETQEFHGTRYAHLYADGGDGSVAAPWTTAGSNPVSAAIADLVDSGVMGGGEVVCLPGCYDLGAGSTAIVIDANDVKIIGGITVRGLNHGNQDIAGGAIVNDDAAVFFYSGSGAAIQVGSFIGSSAWSEGIALKNFKLRQTGTAGTGVGIQMRLARWTLVEEVEIVDFAYGFTLASISDFNTFRRCRTHNCRTAAAYVGYTTGMPTPNGQCNGNVFDECDFMLVDRDTGYTAHGIVIAENSVGNKIQSCQLHNFDTATYAAVYIQNSGGGHSDQTVIENCYIEGCYYGVHHDQGLATDCGGCVVQGNYLTQIEGVGVRINSGSTGKTRGVLIQGNTFLNPSNSAPYDAAKGIGLGTYVEGAVLLGNAFKVGASFGTWAGGNLDSPLGSYFSIDDTTIDHSALALARLRLKKTSVNVTGNDAIVTAGRSFISLTNVSGNNTITLNAPSSIDGHILVLHIAAYTAGDLTLADSGNVNLSAAWPTVTAGGAGDTQTLVAVGVVWVEIARSAN